MKSLLIISIFLISSLSFAGNQRATVDIDGMFCASCASSVEREFKKFPEVASVDISIRTGKAVVIYKDGKNLSAEQINQAVKAAGYKVKSISSNSDK